MKKLFLYLITLLLPFALAGIFDLTDHPRAGGGCCKERNDLSEDSWYDNGLSLNKCRDLNARRDGDNLYRKSGYIYWDRDC
jgi:hypothetical protein